MVYSAEPMPAEVVKSMLDTQWATYGGSIPEPTMIVANDVGKVYMAADHLVIREDTGGETEILRNAYAYKNIKITILIDIKTNVSRQRLYDLKQEIRRIVNNQMHSLTNYHLIRYGGFAEQTETQMNMWEGQVRLTLESDGVIVAT